MDVRMPDGTIISNVPEGITQAEILKRYQAYATQQAPEKPVGLKEELVGGAKRMLGSLQTGVTGVVNPEEAAKEGLARQQAITERTGVDMSKVGQAYEDKGLFAAGKELVGQVPSAIAGQLPNIGTSIAGARTGAMLGAMTGPFAEIGVPLGALAGAFAPSFIQQAGSNLERQAQEGAPISAKAAYGAAPFQAALDVFADKTLFGRLMGIPATKLGGEAAEAVAKQSLKRTLASGTAKGIIAEVPTEVGQQMLERYQAGLSLTDDEARREYLDTAYQTALLGPLGAIGNVQARSEARDTVAQQQAEQQRQAQEQAVQAQRRATGVMEQQPLFTPEAAPVPAQPAAAEQAIPEPTLTIPETPEAEQAPEQLSMFGPRGGVTPEALASVEAARVQGLPAEIAELMKTPEGRKQIASDMKTYFPDLTTKERNVARTQIQQGTYQAEPTPVAEGTLTPEILKQFDITPRSRDFYKALVGGNLADPVTYNLLTTAAESGTERGIKANRILEAFPQYNPNAQQRDLFAGVQNEPEAQAEPVQRDMFGLPPDGVRSTAEPTGTQQGMGMPVSQEAVAAEETPEPVGGGLGADSRPISGGNEQPQGSPVAQPSPLTEKERRAAERAAKAAARDQAKAASAATQALRAEPIEDTWANFDTGMDFNALSPASKDRATEAHKANMLTQDVADDIATIERRNKRTEAANARAAESAEPTESDLSLTEQAQALPTIADQSEEKAMATVLKGIQGKSLLQAVRWLQSNAPSKSHRIIAGFVARRIERLANAGVKFTITVTEPNGKGLKRPLPSARGHASVDFSDPNNQKVDVAIQGGFTDAHGLRYSTVLHEAIHAVTAASILLHQVRARQGKTVPGISEHVNRLSSARDKMVRAATARIEDPTLPTIVKEALVGKVRTDIYKTDLAQRLGVTKQNNAFADVDEFVAWGLTSPELQQFLDSIKMPNTNTSLWSEFVNVIRNLLGIPANQNTVLSELLSASEGLLESKESLTTAGLRNVAVGKEELRSTLPQIDTVAQGEAQQLIQAMSGTLIQRPTTPTLTPSQITQNIVTTAVQNPSGAFKMIESGINKVRTIAADKGAYVAAQIQDFHDGAFYDVNGTVRADMLMSAEANIGNYTDAFFTYGNIDILPNGSVQVTDSANSVDNIYRAARELSDRIGVDTARELITGAFYHYRAAAIKAMPRDTWPENWQQDPRMVPTDAQIKAGLNAFAQVPELETMRREFIGSKNNVVKFLNKAGFLTDERTKEYLADDSYAPWMRIKEYQDKAPGMGNIGRMVDLSQMRKLVGGTEEVNDMLENMAQMLAWGVRSGIKNHTANSALRTMEQMGTAKKHAGRPGSVDPAHVVMTYENGKPAFWTVDNPYDLAAFQSVKGLNSGFMREMSKWMAKLRAGIVLFPVFPIRQVIMDSQRAYLQAGVKNPLSMIGKIMKSFVSGEAYRATDADIQTLQKYGVAAQIDYNTHDATRGMSTKYGLGEQQGGITNWWLQTPAYQFLHKFAYSADLAVRLGIYRQTMEETGDETLAATKAREIINFQKSGTSEMMITLKQVIPFLGAYLQGMDVNYRSMVGRGNSMQQRKAAAAAYWSNVAMYAGMVIAYTMAVSGDDEYEEQKGYVTDRNFLIPGGGLLPVPPDVGLFAKVIPERVTDYMLDEATDNPESAKRLREGLLGAALDAYTPPAAVYGLTPLIELTTNKSFFTDMPIVPEYYQSLKPSEQYTPRTSEFAKSVGQAANISPLQIDYVFNAIGGTSAGAMLQLADVMMGSQKTAPDKLPIVGTFQQKPVGGRWMEEYYAVRELTTQAYNTAKQMAERGEMDKLEAYIAQPEIQARLAARGGVEDVHTLLNKVSEAKNAIDANANLSPDERRQMIDALYTQVEQALKQMGIKNIRKQLE